jgi:hypothetical protein
VKYAPPGFGKQWSPVIFFKLMWTDGELQLIARSTNAYAKAHGAGGPGKTPVPGRCKCGSAWSCTWACGGSGGGYERYWTQVSLGGRCLKVSANKLYVQAPDKPQHPIMRAMPMRRWEQIKRFIHASPIVEEIPQERWFEKMQPLADQVQSNFQRWVILATDVDIDEMMVKFKGRSKDTIRMRDKPIKEGYKVFALS